MLNLKCLFVSFHKFRCLYTHFLAMLVTFAALLCIVMLCYLNYLWSEFDDKHIILCEFKFC